MVNGVWRELQSQPAKGGKIREGKGKKGKPEAAAKLIIDHIHHQSRPTSSFLSLFSFPSSITPIPPPSIIIFIHFYLHHRNLLVIDNSLTSRASSRYFSRSQGPNTNPTTTDILYQDQPVYDVLDSKIPSFINTISVAG